MKKIILLLLLLMLPFTINSCKDDKPLPNDGIEQEYVLKSASNGKTDVTKEFTIYTLKFQKDYTLIVNVSHNGLLEKRISKYEINGNIITENYQGQTYLYTMFNDQLLTIYDDLGDELEIIFITKELAEMNVAVDFNSLLFGEDVSLTKYYNYCPSIMMDTENGKEVMHIWYCTNKDDGVIVDYIGYRKGTKQEDGKWLFTDEEIVLSPSDGTWDARHTCDPSVIKGKYQYKGTTYTYLMAYLGCTTEDYQKNETGIAVSNSPSGPWVKIKEVNPIVPWYDDGDIVKEEAKYESYKGTSTIYWGTGMPSLVSVDGNGEVIMFYASTLRGIGIRRIDLSNLESPVLKYTASITSNGILNSKNQKTSIRIPDFAYDANAKRFYVTGVTNEKNPADVTLTRVNSHSSLAYIENVNNMEELSKLLESGNYTWNMVGYIGPDVTGWERNHNPGILKDGYGYIPNSKNIGVVVSTGHNSWGNENIFTYRLYGHTFIID